MLRARDLPLLILALSAAGPTFGCYTGVLFGSGPPQSPAARGEEPDDFAGGLADEAPESEAASAERDGAWPFGVAPTRIDVVADDGHTLVLWEKRPPMRPRRAILFIHGRTWSALPDFDLQVPGDPRSLMEAFVDQGYVAYALDLRGYGSTPRDATGFNTPDRAVRDILAAVAVVTGRDPMLGAPVLFGWSMGAVLSQLVAQRAPDRLAALVVMGHPADPDRRWPVEPDKTTPERKPNMAAAAAEDFITPGSISKSAIDAYVRVALAADPVRADWRREHEYNELDPAAVKVPTLLLQGEHDPYTKDDGQARLFARLGTSDKVWWRLAGGDHAALLEHNLPEVVAAVVAFVESGAPRRAR